MVTIKARETLAKGETVHEKGLIILFRNGTMVTQMQ